MSIQNPVEIKYKTGRTDYDNMVDKCYNRFLSELEYELINTDNPLKEAKERLQIWHVILFNSSEEGNEIRKLFSDKFINPEKLKKYSEEILSGREDVMLKENDTDINTLGTAKGIIFLVEEIQRIIEGIIKEGGFKKPDYNLSIGTTLEFKGYVDNYSDLFYDWLEASYEARKIDATQISKIRTELDFIKNEIQYFSFFSGIEGNEDKNRTYLIKRLGLKDALELKALCEVAIEVNDGDTMNILSSFNHEKQMQAAKYFAIRKYIDFLNIEKHKKQLPTLKLKISEDILLAKKIEDCYEKLDLDGIIECDKSTFINVFSGVPFEKPIIWVGGKAKEISYFLSKETGIGNELELESVPVICERAAYCFVGRDKNNDMKNYKRDTLLYPEQDKAEIKPDRKKVLDIAIAEIRSIPPKENPGKNITLQSPLQNNDMIKPDQKEVLGADTAEIKGKQTIEGDGLFTIKLPPVIKNSKSLTVSGYGTDGMLIENISYIKQDDGTLEINLTNYPKDTYRIEIKSDKTLPYTINIER